MKKEEISLTKHFCMVPWTHMHTWPNGQVRLCCVSDSTLQPLGNLSDSETLKDIWNSPRMREIRLGMLQDAPISDCNRCYELEQLGSYSMRKEMNEKFSHHFHKVLTTDDNGFVTRINMPYMDIRFSNICNFRCRMCGPDLSSKWFKDAQTLNYNLKHSQSVIHPTTNPEDLWLQIEELLPYVEVIYFAGGEPLIMDEHYRILNWLIDHQRYDVILKYNTNFSVTKFQGQDVFELWNNFKTVEVGASLDTFGKRAEYARKETNWSDIELNRKRMKEICPHVSFYISCTLSIFSFTSIIELHRNWVEKKWIGVDDLLINPLTYPRHYRVHVVPEKFRKKIIKKYRSHIKWLKQDEFHRQETIRRWKSAMEFIAGPEMPEELKNFRTVTAGLDRIRNESFEYTFPELKFLVIDEKPSMTRKFFNWLLESKS